MGSVGAEVICNGGNEHEEADILQKKAEKCHLPVCGMEQIPTHGLNHESDLPPIGDHLPQGKPRLEPIAIIGMAMRLPGGIRSGDDLWELLLSKKDVSSEVPKERYNIDAFYNASHSRSVKTRRGFFLKDDLADVDPSAFGISSTEAAHMDPQQRLLLETVWECMENAGQVDWQGTGKNIGCYVGTFGDDWLEMALRDPLSINRLHIFSSNDFALANRISYQYDLRGPSMTIKTGCSASMIGLHEACQAVASNECSSAIVAGSSLIMTPTMTGCMSDNYVLSPDGECKTFDAGANGFARGEATNAVLIKRLDHALKDGDPIRAVIRATSTNCDGRTRKMAVPSPGAQQALIRKTYQQAGVDPSRTGLFECHGTGTAAGDVAETRAIANVFRQKGVVIGAVKPNLGHSEGASALNSVIKAVLALEHKAIPPNARFKTPNPRIPFKEANLKVPEELMPWPTGRDERVSINSFGIGGANAHAILESASTHSVRLLSSSATNPGTESSPKILTLSAMSLNALQKQIKCLKDYSQSHKPALQDLAYTLGTRRDCWRHRAFAIVSGDVLSEFPDFHSGHAPAMTPESLPFVFTGQGAHWYGMGKELLLRSESFRADIQELDRVLQALPDPPSWTMEEKISISENTSTCLHAEFSQPLCTAVQIGIVNLLASWDVHPTSVIGHSSGEVAAAYAAKAVTAEVAITTAYYRGQAVKLHANPGGMLAVGLGRAAVDKYLEDGIDIACENSPHSTVLSGNESILTRVLDRINHDQPDTFASRLDVETAYHSRLMTNVGQAFEEMVEGRAGFSTPSIPFYSTVLGRALNESDRLDIRYWRQNLVSTVLFSTAISAALADMREQTMCFVEIGPHCPLAAALRQIFRQCKPKSTPLYVSTLHKGQDQMLNMFQAAGQLFLSGIHISLSVVNGRGLGQVLTNLPPYPWDYSAKRWSENRISKAWRLREFPHHEILGSRILESNDQEPTWRNIIRFDNTPWLSDHKLSGRIVFPGAGYVAMVGEAIRQTTGAPGYQIRDMFIRNAMFLDYETDTEIMTAFRPRRLTDVLDSDWYEFTIYSYNGAEWRKNCTGQASAEYSQPVTESITPFVRTVDASVWYRSLKRVGLEFGHHFQGLENISADPVERVAAAALTSREDLGTSDAYAVHPTLIDKSLQLLSVAATRGMTCYLDRIAVPLSIRSVSAWHCENRQLSAKTSCLSVPHGAYEGDTVVVDAGNDRVVLDIKGVRCFAMDAESVTDSLTDKNWSARVDWRPHIDFLPSLQDILPPAPPRMEKEWNLLEQTLVLLLMKMYRLCKGITSSIPHMAKYKSWLEARMNQFKDGGHSIVSQTQDWMRLDPDQQESILTSLTKELKESGTGISFFASFAQRVSENVVSMFEGKTSSLEILMEDNGLEQFYDQMVYPEDYKSFLSTMCHSRANLRILEIGAGTGSMTAAALESLTAPEGGKMFSQYVFTDISPGFLTAAKDRFKQIDGLVFQVLDISKDPVDQDFGLACFDLIICSNVLHATPSLKQSLTHVRKLLSPGGYLFLQETCPELIFADAIMGLLPGWWIGEGDQRASKPHVTPERWHQELSAAGFTGIEAVSHDNIWPYHFNANIISRITDTLVSEKHVSLLHTVVRSDSCLLFEKMLLSAGYTVAWFTLNGISTVQSPGHVISLLDLDAPFFAEMNEEEFLSFRQFISQTSPKSILWITRHIQLECKDPRWSHVLGLGRTLRLELSLPFATVEMDFLDQKLTSSFLNVFESFQSSINSGSEPDYEYSIQGERVYTSRYYPTLLDLSQDGEVIEPNMTPKRLTIGTSGLLDSLHWIPTERIAPGVGEVEVEIRYVGLNFRDMMNAMGFVGQKDQFGFEATGIIRALGPSPHQQEFNVGDRVSIFGPSLLRTTLIAKSSHCFHLPLDISLEDAATIPSVYSTVMYSLVTIGRVQHGQSVLIHSACGGVGLAAIQLCQAIGAEIFATVGSDEKVRYLINNHNIPANRIFHSRSAAFKDQILRETKGMGVDFVLNSLSGESLHASWECVAEYGMMLEIGKRDMLGRGKLNMDLFEANRTFVGVDIERLGSQRPDEFKRTLELVFQYIREGRIQPIRPKNVFDAVDVQAAFKFMRTGQHIGKIVVKFPDDAAHLPVSIAKQESLSFSPNVSYLLVGGLGGLGASISRWMVENGARNLIYLSRSAGETDKSKALFRELEHMGCSIKAVAGSVVSSSEVEKAISFCSKPLGGVIQMAMSLKDQIFSKMTHEDWVTATSPKVEGTWNLYSAVKHQNIDFFVVFGSVVGTCANIGQANYAAANCFVEAFAKHVRSTGFPACAINLGGVEDVGYVSSKPDLMQKARDSGIYMMNENDLFKTVQAAIGKARAVRKSEKEANNEHSIIVGLQPVCSEYHRATYQSESRFSLFSVGDAQSGANQPSDMDCINQFISDSENDPSILDQPSSLELIIGEIGRLVNSPSGESDSSTSVAQTPIDSLMTIEIRTWLRKRVSIDIPTIQIIKAGSIGGLGLLVIAGMRVKYAPNTLKQGSSESKE